MTREIWGFLPASEKTRHEHASQSTISGLVWPMQSEYLSCSSLVTTAEFSIERLIDHTSNMHQNLYTSASLINWTGECLPINAKALTGHSSALRGAPLVADIQKSELLLLILLGLLRQWGSPV